MSDYFDQYFFTSNLTGYICPGFGSDQCQPPNACARDPNTGKEYCCDYGDVCWTITSQCQGDGSTINCGDGDETWCCLDKTEYCTGAPGQFNICWNQAHDTLLDISIPVLNETYLSLSSASPSASSWAFDPATIIAATQTSSRTTSTSTSASSISPTSTGSGISPTAPPPISTTSSPSSSNEPSMTSPSLAIGLIVTGVIVAIALVALAIYCFLQRRRRKNAFLLGTPVYEVDGDQGANKQTQPGWMPIPQELRTNYPTSELPGSQDHIAPYELPANPPNSSRRYQ